MKKHTFLRLIPKPSHTFWVGLLLGLSIPGQVVALDREKLELVGSVKAIVTRETYAGSSNALNYSWFFDRLGNKVKIISGGERDGAFISSIETLYSYNEQGEKTSAKEFWNDGSHIRDRFFYYDEHGNKTLEITYKPGGELEDVLIFLYDNRGNWNERAHFKSGNLWSHQKATHIYDEKKRRIETTLRDNIGKRHKKIYNLEGKIVEKISYHEDGMMSLRRFYQYDNKKNMISNQAFSQEGTLLQKIETTFEYDDIGNWVKRVSQWSVKEGKPHNEMNITQRDITYYTQLEKSSK